MDAAGAVVPITINEDICLLVYQLERGESGTDHLQGYVEFTTRRTLTAAKRLLDQPTAHLERRRGSRAQAIDYCTKEDTRVAGPWSHGDITTPSQQGKRNDIKDFKEWFDLETRSYRQCINEYPQIVARFPNFVNTLIGLAREDSVRRNAFIPNPGWQAELDLVLRQPPHARHVHWIYGRVGGEGKSYFALNWDNQEGLDAGTYCVTGGKHADIFFGYVRSGCPGIVLFDWARGSEESFPYRVLENFKNGFFLNSKYQSEQVRFNVPHLVVFSNFYPDITQLSADRWQIKEV